jgi:translocation and assembly module TamA
MDWIYTHRTNPTESLDGYKLSLNIQGGEQDLLSEVTYFQTQLVGKWLKTLPLSNRLSLRGAIGHTAVRDVDTLPLSVRFYTGGARKLRGYDPQAIGPGTSMFEASAQAQHEVYNQIYVGPFYDAGNAARTLFEDIQSSYGLAATWLSPVGAIELSIAHALTDRGDPFKFQFTMGSEL